VHQLAAEHQEDGDIGDNQNEVNSLRHDDLRTEPARIVGGSFDFPSPA
jgi:hypothetical protein